MVVACAPRGGLVEGQAYRQGAKDYSHRAVQGPQGSTRNAVAQDARSVATVVEGAPNALGHGRAAGGALVGVVWARARARSMLLTRARPNECNSRVARRLREARRPPDWRRAHDAVAPCGS